MNIAFGLVKGNSSDHQSHCMVYTLPFLRDVIHSIPTPNYTTQFATHTILIANWSPISTFTTHDVTDALVMTLESSMLDKSLSMVLSVISNGQSLSKQPRPVMWLVVTHTSTSTSAVSL